MSELALISENLSWHDGHVSSAERSLLLRQQPQTIWFTGLSASGKSTLAYALERSLLTAGKLAYVLDGDNIRLGLNSDLGFSPIDRTENIRRIAEVARLMNDAGLIVISAFISPYRADRAMARAIIGGNSFSEVYVATSLSLCEARDPKGLYKRAKTGEIKEFTGVSAPYEPPLAAVLTLDTEKTSIENCVTQLRSLFKFEN